MLLAPMKAAAPPLVHLAHVDTATALSLQGTIPSPILMPPNKRPKLSLKTNSLSIPYGSSSGIATNRVENNSTATPTTLNTFNNTFDLTLRPSPSSATASPNLLQKPKSNVSTSLRRKVPYDLNLPLGLRPILKNSDLFYESRRSSLATSASPRTTRRVFFPPIKRVLFAPIDEEIVTHTYVARHIDLSSSEDDSSVDSNQSGEIIVTEHAVDVTAETPPETHDDDRGSREESRGRRSTQRSSSSHRSSKRRKKRRWEWTIESLNKTEGEVLIHAQQSSKAEEKEAVEPVEDPTVQGITAMVEEGAAVQPVEEPTLQVIKAMAEGNSHSQEAADVRKVDESPPQNQGQTSTTPTEDPPVSPWMTV